MSWSAFQAPNDTGSSTFAARKLRAMLIARTAYWVNARPSESRVSFWRVWIMSRGSSGNHPSERHRAQGVAMGPEAVAGPRGEQLD